ncbi:MAG TPA: nuclear transport factor 2 family protein [Rhodocyclaceae bacterium]|nr:nuclear transport factor 2 family protein [Rhodocyclaceae bacterium]
MPRTIYATPDDAEQAFYEALSRGDLEAMMNVWSEDEEVVCVQPGGSRFTGLASIREAWRQLFATGMKIKVRISHPIKTQAMLLSVHCVLEHVNIEGDDTIAPPMIATNVFSRGALGWQMILHHTSPAPDTEGLLLQDTPRIVH